MEYRWYFICWASKPCTSVLCVYMLLSSRLHHNLTMVYTIYKTEMLWIEETWINFLIRQIWSQPMACIIIWLSCAPYRMPLMSRHLHWHQEQPMVCEEHLWLCVSDGKFALWYTFEINPHVVWFISKMVCMIGWLIYFEKFLSCIPHCPYTCWAWRSFEFFVACINKFAGLGKAWI